MKKRTICLCMKRRPIPVCVIKFAETVPFFARGIFVSETDSMTLLLNDMTSRLAAAGIESPRLEARLLLGAACGISADEAVLLRRELTAGERERLDSMLRERLAHKPMDKFSAAGDSTNMSSMSAKSAVAPSGYGNYCRAGLEIA